MKENPPESNQSHSNFHIGGKPLSWTQKDTELFWKSELIKSMKEIEPRFTVDNRNKEILSAIYNWVWARNDFLDPSKGFLLWGPLGVGKSVLMRGLQIYEGKINRLRFGCNNKKLGFKITSAAEISLLYAEKGMDGIVRYTDRERMCNLAIDEVGREPTDSKHFGTGINPIQTILQLRYEVRREFITHITTNLNPDKEFSRIYGDYISDRIKEMFNVIEITGATRR